MKEIIINLQGDLDFKLGEALLSKLEELPDSPRKILLDASGLESATLEGASILNRLPERFPQSKFAICSVPNGIEISAQGAHEIPVFSDRDSAKSHLISTESNQTSSFGENSPVLVNCPICFHLLKVQGSGNYGCPACHSKFFVTKDWRISTFERLL
ncbi:STAS domain-containing protein [Leptospira barantonii]|uniref:STAS domain-containing protein n=1 Tax=Leptospira barantonii TaxID=2023184 RepID=UPI0013FD4FBE|nr:STAS domain-containing protein [Leptospira barantonii]